MNKALSVILAVVIAACTLCMLAGCQGDVQPPFDASVTEPAAPAPQDGAPADQSADPAPAAEKVMPAEINSEVIRETVFDKLWDSDTSVMSVKVTAVDDAGNTLWEYTTPQCMPTELDTAQYVGKFGDIVYVNEQAIYDPDRTENSTVTGRLTALDAYTGKPVWQNDEFHGAAVNCAYDDSTGTLYICGYYGPACAAIDRDGKTVFICGSVDESMWWPYQINLRENDIEILFEGTDTDAELPLKGYISYDGTPFAG